MFTTKFFLKLQRTMESQDKLNKESIGDKSKKLLYINDDFCQQFNTDDVI